MAGRYCHGQGLARRCRAARTGKAGPALFLDRLACLAGRTGIIADNTDPPERAAIDRRLGNGHLVPAPFAVAGEKLLSGMFSVLLTDKRPQLHKVRPAGRSCHHRLGLVREMIGRSDSRGRCGLGGTMRVGMARGHRQFGSLILGGDGRKNRRWHPRWHWICCNRLRRGLRSERTNSPRSLKPRICLPKAGSASRMASIA